MRRLLTIAFATLPIALAACGGEGSGRGTTRPPPSPPPPPPPPPTTTAPTTTSTEPDATLALRVYFLADGKIRTAHRQVPQTTAVATSALRSLFAGPADTERAAGYVTAIPDGATFSGLTIEDGVARVRLPSNLSDEALAQIVYTLTQFSTVGAVEIGAARVNRESYERLTPAILVESPAPGDTITSPVAISGTANTFEATFLVQLLVGETKLFEQVVTATSGSGTRGTFSVSVPFIADVLTPATLVAFEQSAEDGRPINRVDVPVSLSP